MYAFERVYNIHVHILSLDVVIFFHQQEKNDNTKADFIHVIIENGIREIIDPKTDFISTLYCPTLTKGSK